MKKLLPVILAVLGLGLGTGAGVLLRPTNSETAAGADQTPTEPASPKTNPNGPAEQKTDPAKPVPASEAGPSEGHEFVKLNNQFVVPVVSGSKVSSLVVMSLSIEVAAGDKEVVFAREPKLRDALLQVMFDHANSGGFDGAFTGGEKMRDLRGSLLEAARSIIGPSTSNVLIIDIVRQDI